MATLTHPPPSISRNGSPQHESFQKFFEWWLVEQNQDLQNLISASTNHKSDSPPSAVSASPDHESALSVLVGRVIKHYEHYYRTKSIWAKQDVLAMLNPKWRSSLEDAFIWIGGWRPSMAFHLLYSKAGLQLEAQLSAIISGFSTGDLADLSPAMLNKIDELQRNTIREEKEITEKMAKVQETVADTSMVELSQVATELMRAGEEGGEFDEGKVEPALAAKKERMNEILHRADDLRLTTLKGILEILSPLQAVHFLIAAAELHLRIHEWGMKREELGGSDETIPR